MSDNDVSYDYQTDFTQGFSSWHVTWPIKDVTKNDANVFETHLKSQSGQRSTVWELVFVVKTEDDNPEERGEGIWLSVCGQGATTETAVIRFALCVDDNDPVFEEASVAMFSKPRENGPHLRLPVKELKSGDRAVVHLWMDIPNAAINANKRKYEADEVVDESPQQKAKDSLSRNFADMFKGVISEDDDFASLSDVTFVLKKNRKDPGRRLLCHRNVLAARSTVFLRMFANKQWKEGANKDERMVEITDIDEETMKHVLRFMYTGSLPDKDNNISNIIYAADKYQLAELKSWCIARLMFDFNTDADRMDQLLLADRHQLDQLKAVCIACLTTNPVQFKNKEMRGILSEDQWTAWITAIAKRQIGTKEISLGRYKY